MSHTVEVVAALGGAALAGLGITPFLHRSLAPATWFKLRWPREVDEHDVLLLLRHLASSRRPVVVTLEVQLHRGRITHLVGVTKSESERLHHLFGELRAERPARRVRSTDPEAGASSGAASRHSRTRPA